MEKESEREIVRERREIKTEKRTERKKEKMKEGEEYISRKEEKIKREEDRDSVVIIASNGRLFQPSVAVFHLSHEKS